MTNNIEILTMDQGTEEWHQARAGYVTASMTAAICDVYKTGANKGEMKAEGDQLAFRLACERMTGRPLDVSDFDSVYMQRGRELEAEARRLYEVRQGFVTVEQVGIIRSTDQWFAASPDGLLEDDQEGPGGLEVKCFLDPRKVRALVLNGDPAEAGVEDQLQWSMLVSGRGWWDLALYCPQLDPIGLGLMIYRRPANPERQKEILERVNIFEERVALYQEKLEARARSNA